MIVKFSFLFIHSLSARKKSIYGRYFYIIVAVRNKPTIHSQKYLLSQQKFFRPGSSGKLLPKKAMSLLRTDVNSSNPVLNFEGVRT